ncbi:hypothetical protein DES53_11691 [Roseimicrobium gellanilyticum]|uniref:Uncharacterized protein n=1 Tax=Roseimicrobium gellanilyticum TaxID=748857 RepID=A0A366H3T6_9BACT|nr:hypothetical protein DES53_11691 [Roseimicrobium gellanilyticum]
MDQTSFSLLAGLLVGSHVGALVVRNFTGWSLWLAYPTGGLVGFLLFAAATFLMIACMAWLRARKQ